MVNNNLLDEINSTIILELNRDKCRVNVWIFGLYSWNDRFLPEDLYKEIFESIFS